MSQRPASAASLPLCTPLLPSPVCLVRCLDVCGSRDRAGPFVRLEEAALAEIAAKVGGRQLLVCTVAGPYRTGKSFLLNWLFGAAALWGKERGFGVSHSASAATKGVWAWAGSLPSAPSQAPRALLVLDTEGLGDPQVPGVSEQDVRRLLLALVLSSSLVFNLQNVINDETLKMLSFVADLPHMMGADDRTSAWKRSMPDLTFLLRDFTKSLDEFGGDATEYVQQMLHAKVAAGDHTCQSILSCFPHIRCSTLMQPVLRPEVELRSLNQPDGARLLRPEFVRRVDAFWSQLLQDTRVKQVEGALLTGSNLSAFVSAVVSAVNHPRASMRFSFPSLCEVMESGEREREIKLAIDTYDKEMTAVLDGRVVASASGQFKLPIDEQSLLQFHAHSKDKALERVRTLPTLQHLRAAVEKAALAKVDDVHKADSLLARAKAKNADASRSLCLSLSAALSSSMEAKLQESSLTLAQFETDLCRMRASYDAGARGPSTSEERVRLLAKEPLWRAALNLRIVQAELDATKKRADEMARATAAMQQQLAERKQSQQQEQARLHAQEVRLHHARAEDEHRRRADKEALEDRCKHLIDQNRRDMSADFLAKSGGPSLPSPWMRLSSSERARMQDDGSRCPWCPAKGVHSVPHVSATEEWRCRMCSKAKRGVMRACVACGSRIDDQCFSDYLWEN